MLRGISPLISPDLLSMLHCMGHGDEVVMTGDTAKYGNIILKKGVTPC